MRATRTYGRCNREGPHLAALSAVVILLLGLASLGAALPAQAQTALPPDGKESALVRQFDKDGDGRLNRAERNAARRFLAAAAAAHPSTIHEGDPGVYRVPFEPPPPAGAKLTPADVKSYSDAPLYDPATLRTLFLQFEDPDWENEMSDFYRTGVDVPATLTVDGKTYREVGVHFRGTSSFGTVNAGYKRSLNLSLDFADKQARLQGYTTLELLNSHEDPTFLRTVLSLQMARDYMPAPKANYVRVVINGESWGVYVNSQQFDKISTREWFGSAEGARWHVPGSPIAQGSLAYLGEDAAPYRKIYEIRSKDSPESWAALIHLCKVLSETPPEHLEAALAPILDTDGALKFLALENVLINNDGYWIRTSDYNLFEDKQGRFHIIPHDMNETFSRPDFEQGGSLKPGREAVEGVKLDPLFAANDPKKPLISRLLAVPSLRARYLANVHDMAQKWLDWNKLGPLAEQYQALIAADVAKDTHKLYSAESFKAGVMQDVTWKGFGDGTIGLKQFADQRRAYLLGTAGP